MKHYTETGSNIFFPDQVTWKLPVILAIAPIWLIHNTTGSEFHLTCYGSVTPYFVRGLGLCWIRYNDFLPNWISHNCRIKTSHSNLVSCFGPRMRALAKVFYRGESRGKIPCQRPNPTRYPFLPLKTIWFCHYRHCTPSQLWMHASVTKERRLMTSQYHIFDRTDNLNPQWMQAVNG